MNIIPIYERTSEKHHLCVYVLKLCFGKSSETIRLFAKWMRKLLWEIAKSRCVYVNVDGLMMLNPQWFWNARIASRFEWHCHWHCKLNNILGLRMYNSIRTNYYTEQCYTVHNFWSSSRNLCHRKTSIAKSNCALKPFTLKTIVMKDKSGGVCCCVP